MIGYALQGNINLHEDMIKKLLNYYLFRISTYIPPTTFPVSHIWGFFPPKIIIYLTSTTFHSMKIINEDNVFSVGLPPIHQQKTEL